jgi:hypothetical protein
MADTLIYPGSSSFFPGQTPFGTYDNEYQFQEDAPKVALWCARRLGYPIQNVELIDENLYACFEEATSEYGSQVNQFNIRNDLDTLKGNPSGTNYSGKLVQGSNLANLIAISEGYGTQAGVGGKTDIKRGSIDLVPGQQIYDLDTLFDDVNENEGAILWIPNSQRMNTIPTNESFKTSYFSDKNTGKIYPMKKRFATSKGGDVIAIHPYCWYSFGLNTSGKDTRYLVATYSS